MHRYLRAIGFSNLKSRLQVNNLLAYVIQNADEKKYTKDIFICDIYFAVFHFYISTGVYDRILF